MTGGMPDLFELPALARLASRDDLVSEDVEWAGRAD
jgi:hypothetical protein